MDIYENIDVSEGIRVSQDPAKWRSIVSAYPNGNPKGMSTSFCVICKPFLCDLNNLP